jgi:exopolysaccharide biosynthesis operon protein EpsL
MKKSSIRPLLTTIASACLMPVAAQAQSALQSPPATQPGGTTATSVEQSMSTPMGVQMTPSVSVSQPTSPVSSDPAFSEPDTIKFRAMAGIERDDNVFRTGGAKVSDEIFNLGVGVKADKRIGLQRIVADIEANRYTYNDLNGLDYGTLNYSAALYWKVSNILEGIASADRRQFRDITDSIGLARAVSRRTERNEVLEGGYRFGAGWRALAGLRNNDVRSDDPRSFDANTEVRSAHVGASYDFASGSTVAARVRRGDGEYSSLAGSDFEDSEIEGTMRWAITPKTTFDGRLAHTEREHSGTPGRDFSGVVGHGTVNWEITAKTGIRAGYARDLGSYLAAPSGHVESDRFFVSPVWRPTAQIGVNLRYEHEVRRWEDVTAAAFDAGRKDTFNIFSAGVDWEPRRAVTVSGTVRHERRSSNLPALSYRANVMGVAVKLTL